MKKTMIIAITLLFIIFTGCEELDQERGDNVILENYIALSKDIDSAHFNIKNLNEKEQEISILQKVSTEDREIYSKFKNPIVYKINIPNKHIGDFWSHFDKIVSYKDAYEENQIIEIYSCYKEERDLKESLIVNKNAENKPELKNGRYIIVGNFIRGEEIIENNHLASNIDEIEILSISQDKDKLFVDIIKPSTIENYNSEYKYKDLDRRKAKLKSIETSLEHIESIKVSKISLKNLGHFDEIKFNNKNSKGRSCNYISYNKDKHIDKGYFQNLLFKYYENQNRIPVSLLNRDSVIERMEFENFNLNEPIHEIKIIQEPFKIEYPIQLSTKVKLGENEGGKTLEYTNPHDNKKYKVYINAIVKLKDAVPKEYQSDLEKYLDNFSTQLTLFYENPNEDIKMNFYLKSFLDSKQNRNSGSSIGIIGLSNKQKGENGYNLHTKLLDEFNEDIEELDVELFSITQMVNREPIKFEKADNPKEPLKDYIKVKGIAIEEISIDPNKNHKYIRFTPEKLTYCKAEYARYENYVSHEEIQIPMGKSRIGGPVIDLPKDIEHPEDLFFAAQLNLEEFNKHYINDYLPKKGFLYFFTDHYCEEGKVIYSDCKKEDLKRVIKEHGDSFYSGNLIKDIYVEEESLSERYDEGWAEEGEEIGFNPFSGTEKSKIFGLYTNCQCGDEEIIDEMLNDEIILLQVGEDFTKCGVFTVRININDLKHGDFSKCTFEWSQS